MQLTMHIVDAFTDTLFHGNSAAVVINDTWLESDLMQSIALENNLSETAFLVKDAEGVFHIRWFSPITEIDFCGHATLASAFVLFEAEPEQKSLTFYAKAVGQMTITKNTTGQIEMDFPNRAPHPVAKADIPTQLLDGLSIPPLEVLKNDQAYFAVYPDEKTVRAITQAPAALKQLGPLDVVVTAEGDEADFVSRYFWPANGGDEDPVTGSIHTGLAPFWASRLNKHTLIAKQVSKRTGTLYCEVINDRVKISGHAVKYLTGSISVG